MLKRRQFVRNLVAVAAGTKALRAQQGESPHPTHWRAEGHSMARRSPILNASGFHKYVEYFNGIAREDVDTYIPDDLSWQWMSENVPYFACPDRQLEETYYYRWWGYRKAIKQTPKGFIVTEFLKPVKHATEFNALSCAFGHHSAEGRWLHDPKYIDEYTAFWLKSRPDGGLQPRLHQFSGWVAAAVYERWCVTGDTKFLLPLLDSLVLDYQTWEHERQLPDGLFWQRDVADGMESSISGGRKVRNMRPTINSYMYGNACAIKAIADCASRQDLAAEFSAKARRLRELIQGHLWNKQAGFFETVLESGAMSGVREEIGFIPWYFHLPEAGKGYERAWDQLMSNKGFRAPYGLTTAEQRDPRCRIVYGGDDCQWNGPVWPFATTQTLTALSNVLNDYQQDVVSKEDYFATLITYAQSQILQLPDGRRIPWIDENLDPFTGEWIARQRKIDKGTFYGRGDHYNHSCFADLIITGLVGLRPRPDEVIELNPLLPDNKWEWFCLDNVLYRGHIISVVWDRAGTKFDRGAGLTLFVDGNLAGQSPGLGRLKAKLGKLPA
jgi:hypothetical protein